LLTGLLAIIFTFMYLDHIQTVHEHNRENNSVKRLVDTITKS